MRWNSMVVVKPADLKYLADGLITSKNVKVLNCLNQRNITMLIIQAVSYHTTKVKPCQEMQNLNGDHLSESMELFFYISSVLISANERSDLMAGLGQNKMT